MQSLKNIRIISHFELKTLLRSWFFRIFAAIAILLLGFLNVMFFTGIENTPWTFRAIPSNIPYFNLIFLNVIQSIIAVFLASDYIRRDKKLDTTEVIFIRPVANWEYIFGKTLGIVLLFLGLNIAILLVGMIINIISKTVPLNPMPYLYYLGLISLPSLVFIIGLSYVVMSLVKNQAITFVVLLGYIAVTLFYLHRQFFFLFDYMSFNMPLTFSELAGFSNLKMVLMHRSIYLLVGLGLISLGILFFKRLPQVRHSNAVATALSIVFIVGGLSQGFMYYNRVQSNEYFRQEARDLNNEYSDYPRVDIESYTMEITHKGKKISADVAVNFSNPTDEEINDLIFSLNPDLKVESVKLDGRDVSFEREKQILKIQPTASLKPGSNSNIQFIYSGGIDERIAYLDADSAEYANINKVIFYTLGNRYAYLEDNYALLTLESLWYPVPGVYYSDEEPLNVWRDFASYDITINNKKGLKAFTQGKDSVLSDSRTQFITERPLPQVSLVIGNYIEKKIQVDSITYSLCFLEGNDIYTPYLTEITDTLPDLIREWKRNYESQIFLDYPFQKLMMIESPAHFNSVSRLRTLATGQSQPQMVFFPEKGFLFNQMDFHQQIENPPRWQRRNNESLSEAEKQANTIERSVREILLSSERGGFDMRGRVSKYNPYNIAPNYYAYSNYIGSKEFPFINLAMESYFYDLTRSNRSNFVRNFTGISDEERANLALSKNSLEEIIRNNPDKQKVDLSIKSKGNYLISLLEYNIGKEKFKDFIRDFVNENRYTMVSDEVFKEKIRQDYQFDLNPLVEDWYTGYSIPAFIIRNSEVFKTKIENRDGFQYNIIISNVSNTGGLISIESRGGGPRFGRGGQDSNEDMYYIEGGQTVKIGLSGTRFDRRLNINTHISQNLPAQIDIIFDEPEEERNIEAFEGMAVLDEFDNSSGDKEIIVDNEEPGFHLVQDSNQNMLRRFIKENLLRDQLANQDTKYKGMNSWRPPTEWTPTTNARFYGDVIKSAYYIKSGEGNSKAQWTASINEPGYYDVFYYVFKEDRRGRRGGNQNSQRESDYKFTVFNDDGEDEVFLDANQAENGWNHLGSFYFSTDSAKVEITNNFSGRIVLADAVKWVRQN